MLVKSGDLIPVRNAAVHIPWTRRRSQVLNYLHRGDVDFETFVYDSNVGDISKLSTYFNPFLCSVDDLNNKFGVNVGLTHTNLSLSCNKAGYLSSASTSSSSLASLSSQSRRSSLSPIHDLIASDLYSDHQSQQCSGSSSGNESMSSSGRRSSGQSSLIPRLLIYPEAATPLEESRMEPISMPMGPLDKVLKAISDNSDCEHENGYTVPSAIVRDIWSSDSISGGLNDDSVAPSLCPTIKIDAAVDNAKTIYEVKNDDLPDADKSSKDGTVLVDRIAAVLATRRIEQRRTPSLPDWAPMECSGDRTCKNSDQWLSTRSLLAQIIRSTSDKSKPSALADDCVFDDKSNAGMSSCHTNNSSSWTNLTILPYTNEDWLHSLRHSAAAQGPRSASVLPTPKFTLFANDEDLRQSQVHKKNSFQPIRGEQDGGASKEKYCSSGLSSYVTQAIEAGRLLNCR